MDKIQPAKIAVGFRIGRLEVQCSTDKRKNGYTVWQCRCDCGKQIQLDTRALQRGTIQDCGCISKVKSGVKDLTGRRFGKLICLKASDQRSRRRVLSSNTSGYTGVYQDTSGKWHSQITFKGKTYVLGTFDNIEDAVSARRNGERMHEHFLEWYYEEYDPPKTENRNGSLLDCKGCFENDRRMCAAHSRTHGRGGDDV